MRRQTQYIMLRGGRTLHHAVRVARSIGLEPNILVTIRFSETSLTSSEVAPAFAQIRAKFGKWVQRPSKRFAGLHVPPTFLWVLENPNDEGRYHAHWLLFVPSARQLDFSRKLARWLEKGADVYSPEPIHIEPVTALLGAVNYMLKGQFPFLARHHGIDPVYQGWIVGKRSGCSANIGPTQHERLWKAGKHPRPQRWRIDKYRPRQESNTQQLPL